MKHLVQVERFETTAKTLTPALVNSYSYGEEMSNIINDLYVEMHLEEAVENYVHYNTCGPETSFWKEAVEEKLAEVSEYSLSDQLDFILDWKLEKH